MTDTDGYAPAEPANGNGEEGHVPAAGLIEKFGGIRPMAAKLEIAVSTVQGWKQRDAIPRQRLGAIHAAAARHGMSLDDIAPDGVKVEPATSKPAAGAKPARRNGQKSSRPRSPLLPLGMAGGALLLALVALALSLWRSGLVGEDGRLTELVTRLTFLESAPTPAPDRQLVQRIAELEQRLSQMAAAPASAPDPRLDQLVAQTEAARVQMAALEDRLAGLASGAQPAEAGAALAALQSEVEALHGKVSALTGVAAQADGRTARALALSLAVGQLRAAVGGGRAYAKELAAIAAFGIDDAAVAEAMDLLAPHAASRVPGLAVLRADFAAVARHTVLAQREADDEDWLDRLFTRAAALVSVRAIGPDVTGEGGEAVMARAEARLAVPDLAGAVREVESLAGPAAAAAADWLAGARANLAAAEALAALDAHARAALTAPAP